jgi:hypothetical protein
VSLLDRLHRAPADPPAVRYEARFHRTDTRGSSLLNADAWTWQVRKIYPRMGLTAVTNFDPGYAESYKRAREAATEFIEHQKKIDGTPWEEL